MPFAPRLILHTPLSDETLLGAFVEQCLKDGVSLVAVVGPDCARVEDIIDGIVVGDGGDSSRFLFTTSHPNEPFEDVLNMVRTWANRLNDFVEEVRL